ncbi:hypothetical protein ACFSGI_08920 [Paenibacillus nicotianae]|uniref:Uncharacterized protein n=1 Tax=Paenibacillus nicotianae TaxID=1526551 RepID=A0ABW4UVD0_9BACL
MAEFDDYEEALKYYNEEISYYGREEYAIDEYTNIYMAKVEKFEKYTEEGETDGE